MLIYLWNIFTKPIQGIQNKKQKVATIKIFIEIYFKL